MTAREHPDRSERITDAMVERVAQAIAQVGVNWRLETDFGLRKAARAAISAALDEEGRT